MSSDTPQGQINKLDILQGKWASSTSANETTSNISDYTSTATSGSTSNTEAKTDNGTSTSTLTNSNTSNSNLNEHEEYRRTKEGRETGKTKSELLFEYRKNLMNVYERIINDLNPLFFALF